MTFRYLDGYCNEDASASIAREDAGKSTAEAPTDETGPSEAIAQPARLPRDNPDPHHHR